MMTGKKNDETTSYKYLCKHIPDRILPIVGGCVAFGTTLAMSTAVQKLVGISTGNKVIPTLLGITTVCAASLVSERTAIITHDLWKDPNKKSFAYVQKKIRMNLSVTTTAIMESSSQLREKRKFKLPMHEVRVCLLGLLAFKALGGRFWGISPSSFTQLGSFSRWSIPCTENYANANQRTMVERMGRKWGCHTCGSHMYFKSSTSPTTGKVFRFVGDHMPPKSVAKQMDNTWLRRIGLLPKVKFRFYPQCVTCSSVQGSILSKAGSNLGGLSRKLRVASMEGAGGGRTAYSHGLRPRINHLTGGVLAGVIVLGATNNEIAKGNSKRLERWQTWIESTIRRCQK